MVWGNDANPDALPLDLIAACAAAGIKPYRMRRYLDRPAVIAHLRAEHRKFREVVCCGNAAALGKVRDTSENGMAIVASVRALDGMQTEEAGHADAPTPGISIRLVQINAIQPQHEPRLIEADEP